LLARARDLRVVFLIPDGKNEFMANLTAAIARRARHAKTERLTLETQHIKPLDAQALVRALDGLQPKSCDCAVIVATEDEAVQRAVDAATRRGIAVMTLVSDLPGSSRKLFIGIDNVAAGRTAASLLGRFCRKGKIGVIAGSMGLRDHRERLEGFTGLLRAEFPRIEILGPAEGHDERAETEHLAADLLAAHPDLAGIYNLGAGNLGLLAALQKSGCAGKVWVIAHELTDPTRAGL
jgi:LacI family transcriptional regulator